MILTQNNRISEFDKIVYIYVYIYVYMREQLGNSKIQPKGKKAADPFFLDEVNEQYVKKVKMTTATKNNVWVNVSKIVKRKYEFR